MTYYICEIRVLNLLFRSAGTVTPIRLSGNGYIHSTYTVHTNIQQTGVHAYTHMRTYICFFFVAWDEIRLYIHVHIHVHIHTYIHGHAYMLS